MKNDVQLSNRVDIVEKTFVVKVSYPSWMETPVGKINEQLILNKISAENDLIEASVEEINEST